MRKQNLLFATVLSVTLCAVLALCVALVIIMNGTSDGEPPLEEPSQTTPADDGSVPVGGNNTPLYPTVESRESYKITTSAGVVTLRDDSVIKSNNTVLVRVGDSSLESIVEKDAGAKIYPASMTKVMTLLVACERVTDLDRMLTIEEKHLDYLLGSGGGSSFFGADTDNIGERISVRDALYLISYKSDTIACHLIADHIAGSEEAFVALMNEKAQSLGLDGTHFANCTGLYNAEHYSTCKDIASIMVYAMDNELARTVLTSTGLYSFKSDKFYTKKDPTKKVTYSLYSPDWYGDEGRFNSNNKLDSCTVIAGKTGYVDESGVSLVSYATDKNGGKYINVIVGKPKGQGLSESISTSEVKKIYNQYAK